MLLVNLIVSVPDVLKLVGGNALAVVGNIYSYLFADNLLGYNNGFVLACVVYGIIDKVVYYL